MEINDIKEKLLPDVRNYLDITWEDDAGDKKICGIIARGISAINAKGGAEFDYTEEALPRSLLLQYVLYERENALDDFWRNYKPDIIGLQIREKVRRYAEKEAGEL